MCYEKVVFEQKRLKTYSDQKQCETISGSVGESVYALGMICNENLLKQEGGVYLKHKKIYMA